MRRRGVKMEQMPFEKKRRRCYLRYLEGGSFQTKKKMQIDSLQPSLCFEGGINLGGCQGVSLEKKPRKHFLVRAIARKKKIPLQ